MNSDLLSTWMKKAAAGESEAQEIVVLAMGQQMPIVIESTARKHNVQLNEMEINELTQDILKDVISANYSYDSSRSPFGVWATVLVKRKLLRFLKIRNRTKTQTDITIKRGNHEYSLFVPLRARPETGSVHELTETFAKELELALPYLVSHEAQAIRLRLAGKSLREIQTELGITHQTALNHYNSGVEHVRQRLEWLETTEGIALSKKIDLLEEPFRGIYIATTLDGRSELSVARDVKLKAEEVRRMLSLAKERISAGHGEVCEYVFTAPQ